MHAYILLVMMTQKTECLEIWRFQPNLSWKQVDFKITFQPKLKSYTTPQLAYSLFCGGIQVHFYSSYSGPRLMQRRLLQRRLLQIVDVA